MEKSIVGDLINFRGLVYAPINENGVVFLFGKVVEDLNMYVEEIKPGFPDCVARRYVGKGWERVRIEFELQSKNFISHGHDKDGCDIIICWEHNWEGCPLEVIELKTEIAKLDNYRVQPPTSKNECSKNDSIETYFRNKQVDDSVRNMYKELEERFKLIDDSVWQKYGDKYIGWYSPERSFASFLVKKSTIKLEVFCGHNPIAGTKICNEKFSPRWCRLSIKPGQIEEAIAILKESQEKIKDALANGETTGYFSGGQPFKQTLVTAEDDDESVGEGSDLVS